MAQDELAQDAVADAGREQRGEDALADVVQVGAGRRRVQLLDLAAHRAGSLEGVVELGELGAQQRQPGVAVGQPQILVGGDVREVPDERAHDRRVGALERRVVEVRDERVRRAARVAQGTQGVRGIRLGRGGVMRDGEGHGSSQ